MRLERVRVEAPQQTHQGSPEVGPGGITAGIAASRTAPSAQVRPFADALKARDGASPFTISRRPA